MKEFQDTPLRGQASSLWRQRRAHRIRPAMDSDLERAVEHLSQIRAASEVDRKASPPEAAYVASVLDGQRRGARGAQVAFAVGSVVASVAGFEEAWWGGLLFLLTGVYGVWALSHVISLDRDTHGTERVVCLSGPLRRLIHQEGSQNVFNAHSVGGTQTGLPRGWASLVAKDDEIDAEAVVAVTSGARGDILHGYMVVAARRRSDGARFSISDEWNAGGAIYHRASVFVALMLLPVALAAGGFHLGLDGEWLGVPALLWSGTLSWLGLGLVVTAAVPYAISRARVNRCRARGGLLRSPVHLRRRARWIAVFAAGFGLAFGTYWILFGSWEAGALRGALAGVTIGWAMSLPRLRRTRQRPRRRAAG